LIAEE
jgi:hypothetical protein